MSGNTILPRKLIPSGREVCMPDVGLRNVQWKLVNVVESVTAVTPIEIDVTEHHTQHLLAHSPKLSKSKRPFW